MDNFFLFYAFLPLFFPLKKGKEIIVKNLTYGLIALLISVPMNFASLIFELWML